MHMRSSFAQIWLLILIPGMAFAQPSTPAAPSQIISTAVTAELADQPAATPPEKATPVQEGLFPKSIRIPGTELSLGIGGYVKVDVIQDFNAIGDAFEFKTNTIPADGTAAAAQSGLTTIHARETRVNLDLRSNTPHGKFRAFVEGDFFGSGNSFRLRHGFGEFGRLLGGQTWTTFMDISARPLTLDFEGPDGEVFVRQAMVRWTQPLAPNWTLAVAAENPTPQFAIPAGVSGSARNNVPDIPASVRYQRPRGHVQVAGLLRQLRFDGGQGTDNESVTGWGVNATFAVTTVGKDSLQGQFMIGQGVARYIEALGGQNVDAVLVDGDGLTAVRAQGGLVGYTHHWQPTLKSGIAYSTASVDDAAGLAGSTVQRTQDVRVTTIFTPYPLVDVGGEILWGRRDNLDGSHGVAVRFQFAVIFRL